MIPKVWIPSTRIQMYTTTRHAHSHRRLVLLRVVELSHGLHEIFLDDGIASCGSAVSRCHRGEIVSSLESGSDPAPDFDFESDSSPGNPGVIP